MTTLDAVRRTSHNPSDRTRTLVKIDVEGAEMDATEGRSWMVPSNLFVDRSAQKAISRSIAGDFRGTRLATRRPGSKAAPAFGPRAVRLAELVAGIRFRIDVNRERFPIGGTEAGRSYDA
jgi:hypothetical protein